MPAYCIASRGTELGVPCVILRFVPTGDKTAWFIEPMLLFRIDTLALPVVVALASVHTWPHPLALPL
jgi:hypothetical protein